MTDTPALEALTAAAQDHETSGIHGPLHCSLACGASLLAALTANGYTVAPVAEAEAGRAVLALEDDWTRWYAARYGDKYIVRLLAGDQVKLRGEGDSIPAAIAAALQDEATR